ncbi:MAG: hypothetical protein ACOXZK_09740 [Bacteroidales bacterium]
MAIVAGPALQVGDEGWDSISLLGKNLAAMMLANNCLIMVT